MSDHEEKLEALHSAVAACANKEHPANQRALANPGTTICAKIPAALWTKVLTALENLDT